MKRLVCALTLLGGVAVTILARAAEPAPPVLTAAPASCPAGGCCMEEVIKKKCIAVPETKKHTHVIHACKCIDYCLPRCCPLPHHKKHGCDDGACGEACCDNCAKCGCVRTRKVLLKKFVTEEECQTKCEVTHEMQLKPIKHKKCKNGSCPAPAWDSAPVMAPAEPGAVKGESIPAPKEEAKDQP